MKRKGSGGSAPSPPAVSSLEPTPVQEVQEVQEWSASHRVAFRFGVLYLGLFSIATQILGSLLLVPLADFYFRGLGPLWPMREITFWISTNVFGVTAPLVYTGTTGETVFFWVQTLWLFVAAVGATAVWSLLDRHRRNYVTLHKWFRFFVRLGLASQMLEYGMTKVIPTQFPPPTLNTLVTPAGNLSLSAMLWTSIGSAPGYEIFTGCIEVLGGILLLIPRTTMLGAILSLAAMTQVFVLNMTYDVGLKQVSFHLILLAIFLLAPDFRRLGRLFLLNQGIGPSTQAELFGTRRRNRIAIGLQVLLGIYWLGVYAYVNLGYWYAAGPGSPRSALYGIWNVEQLSIDGQVRPPVLNDYDRQWRRVIFDAPAGMVFQRFDDSFARYGVSIDVYKNTLSLTKGDSKTWKSAFSFERIAPDGLSLEGEMDGHRIRMQLQLVEFDTFRLLNSGFRWIRPPD